MGVRLKKMGVLRISLLRKGVFCKIVTFWTKQPSKELPIYNRTHSNHQTRSFLCHRIDDKRFEARKKEKKVGRIFSEAKKKKIEIDGIGGGERRKRAVGGALQSPDAPELRLRHLRHRRSLRWRAGSHHRNPIFPFTFLFILWILAYLSHLQLVSV